MVEHGRPALEPRTGIYPSPFKYREQALLAVPTMLVGVWGMNFKHMPELEWRYGYAWALGLMVLSALGMLGYFKRRGWW